MDAVTQVVDNSDFAKKGLLLGLLNTTAYARSIKPEIEEITKKQVVNDSSIVMALSRYGKLLRQHAVAGSSEKVIQNISSNLQLVELVFDKTPEAQERLAMLNLLDAIKRASFFVSTVSMTQITVIVEAALSDMVRAHFGGMQSLDVVESLAGLTLKLGAGMVDRHRQSYKVLEQLASRNITVVEYTTSPTELNIILYEKDASKAFQALHREFLKTKD